MPMPARPAFLFDSRLCTGCKACMIACKDKNDLDPGVRWRRVTECTGGEWTRTAEGYRQNVFSYYLSVSCNHCEDPICVQSCPTTGPAFWRHSCSLKQEMNLPQLHKLESQPSA